MTDIKSQFISADGLNTHYLEAGSGPPLVLIHGGGAGADAQGNWQSCIPLYADDFHVIAVDMVGFGKTEKPDPETYTYSQANRNKHIIGFLKALGLGPVNLIGNSMGGATSIGVVLEAPELVSKLVLMGAAGLDISNPDPNAKKALGGYDYTPEGMRQIMKTLTGPNYVIDEDLLQYRYDLTCDPEVKRAMGAIGKELGKSGMIYPEEAFRTIKTPTLVVGGKEDKIAVPARNYRYMELIENSWGFMLPHCGHWVMMEAPQEFAAITKHFFSSDLFRAPA